MREIVEQFQNNSLDPRLLVIVLSAGLQEESWKEEQKYFSSLTENTKQEFVEDSWHAIQIHKLETVIQAIKEMIEGVK